MTSRTCVVVPTRGTTTAIERICANIAGNVCAYDLLIILNGTDETKLKRSEALATEKGLQTVRCPGGGVARARNFALATSDADVLVFVDDDVVVTADAIKRLSDVIASDVVDVATARVLPTELPQQTFNTIYDAYLGFDRGTERRSWQRPGQLSPFTVWDIGVGALFAVNRPKVLEHKAVRFDERLSNGRFCGGTEDVDFFMQAFHAGLRLTYEPEAVVHHQFPDDWTGMRRKCRQYALTDGAFYAKWYREADPVDFVNEIRGWARRLAMHGVRAVEDRPRVPLVSVAIEPLYKLFGAAAWAFVLMHRTSAETTA
jgi:cellulose synthase/poly-beta-1,6-N-acetylglucosamine synthase-like glycosyltransferase